MLIGDKVAVIDDDIVGLVLSVNNDLISIMTDDGFEMEFAMNELVIMDNTMDNTHINAINLEKHRKIENKPRNSKKFQKNKAKDGKIKPMEVDLHINQLIKSAKGFDNYDILNIQIDEAKKQLEFAINKRIPRIVFIHGVGAGVLRAELEFLFKRFDNIKYYDADYQLYGRGATEVYIFQNKKN